MARPGGSARIFRAHRATPFYRRFRWDENVPIVKRGRKVERLQHMGYAAEYRNVLRALAGNLDPMRRVELERRKGQLEEWFNRRENPNLIPGPIRRVAGKIMGRGDWILPWPEFVERVHREGVRRGAWEADAPLGVKSMHMLRELYDSTLRAYRLGGPEGVDEYLERHHGVTVLKGKGRGKNPMTMLDIIGMGVIAGAVQGLVEPVVTKRVYGGRVA